MGVYVERRLTVKKEGEIWGKAEETLVECREHPPHMPSPHTT